MSSYLTVWDAESDTVAYFDFTTGMTDQQQYEAETDAALAAGQRPTTAAVRYIVQFFIQWWFNEEIFHSIQREIFACKVGTVYYALKCCFSFAYKYNHLYYFHIA